MTSYEAHDLAMKHPKYANREAALTKACEVARKRMAKRAEKLREKSAALQAEASDLEHWAYQRGYMSEDNPLRKIEAELDEQLYWETRRLVEGTTHD